MSMRVSVCVCAAKQKSAKSKIQVDWLTYTYTYEHLICERRNREKKIQFIYRALTGLNIAKINWFVIDIRNDYISFFLSSSVYSTYTSTHPPACVRRRMYVWTWMYAYIMNHKINWKWNDSNAKQGSYVKKKPFLWYLIMCHLECLVTHSTHSKYTSSSSLHYSIY